jgi:hypothetical protein
MTSICTDSHAVRLDSMFVTMVEAAVAPKIEQDLPDGWAHETAGSFPAGFIVT